MSSSRGLVKPPGNKQLPITNWHSRLNEAVTSFHLRPAGVERRGCSGLVQGRCSAAEDETMLG